VLEMRTFTTAMMVVCCLTLSSSEASAEQIIADHLATAAFETIPASYISDIETSFHIYYAHTSHGSQIVTGLTMLYDEDPQYDPPYFIEPGDDLGHNGDTSWVPATRVYLDAHHECNVAMFSWCGGASDNTEEGINTYLNKMVQLEGDYPDVLFIYMTGHLDGTGPSGNLYASNNQIRAFCNSNDKVLFDFADIESWDPDGTYYPDETDACYWCTDWCILYSCPSCGGCAHSHCFNCYQKGKAWWWMMARVLGWNPDPQDSDSDGVVDGIDNCPNTFNPTQLDSDENGIGDVCDCCLSATVGDLDQSGEPAPHNVNGIDLSMMIDGLFIGLDWTGVCLEEADADFSNQPDPTVWDIDGADLSVMIDALFISLDPLTACP